MDLKEFQVKIPESVDVRPFLPDVVHLYTQGNRKAYDSAYGPEGYVIKAVEKETGFWKPPQRRIDRSRKKTADDDLTKDYASIVRAWKRENSTSRGDRNFAVAVFYWFFRYVPESVYFIEIAKKTWPNGSDIFKRFVYAKCGGSEQDNFETVCDRFKAPIAEVTEAFDRIWIDEKPPFKLELPTRSSELYHYTNDAIEILGREAEQAALERFRDAGPGFRWWQIAGVAGQGKSRLALEIVTKTRNLPEWEAGFLVDYDAISAFAVSCENWSPTKPHLIVIDYRLARTKPLKIAMQTLKKRHTDFAVPVCLLLVERQPWNLGGFGPLGGNRASWFCEVAGNPSGQDVELESLNFEDRQMRDSSEANAGASLELKPLNPEHFAELTFSIAEKENTQIFEDVKTIKEMQLRIDGKGRPLYAYFLAKALGRGRSDVTNTAESLLEWVLQTDRHRRWISVFGSEQNFPGVGSKSPNYFDRTSPMSDVSTNGTV